MTQIHTKFSNLLSQLPTFGNVDTESLMSACDEIASMIGLFGASMLSVRASVTDNLVKIRKQLAMLDVGSDLRVETVIFAERSRCDEKEGSVSQYVIKTIVGFHGNVLGSDSIGEINEYEGLCSESSQQDVSSMARLVRTYSMHDGNETRSES